MRLASEIKSPAVDPEVLNCVDALKRTTESISEAIAVRSLKNAIDLLSSDEKYAGELRPSCAFMSPILSLYMEYRSVVEMAVQYTSLLCCSNTDNCTQLGKPTCDLLVIVLKTYISHADVVKYACKCVKLLGEVESNLVHFARNDCCEAITNVLQKYGSGNEMIAEWGCKSIFVLARKSEKNQLKLGMRTCELLVVGILKSEVHKNSIVVKASVAAAVGALAFSNSANKRYFMESGACWIILKLLELSYAIGPEYCTACCYCLSNIAESDSNIQYQYHNWGAIPTVLKSLEANNKVPHVAVQCFRAMRSLSHDNVLVRAELIALKACDLIVASLRLHSSVGLVVEWGLSLVSSLAEYRPSALESLLSAGIFECLVDCFQKNSLNLDVAVFLCQATAKLAKEQTREFADKIYSLRLGAELMKCLGHCLEEPLVAEEGCNAVGTIAGMSGENRRDLIDAGAFSVVVKTLYQHDKKDAVVEQCAYALANLSIDLPAASSVHALCFKAVNKILLQQAASKAVVLWAFIALSRLCEGDAHMSRLLVTPSAVLDIMRRYSGNAELIAWGLRAVMGLLPPPENNSRFLAANIAETISSAISDHNDVEAIVELVLVVVAFMSADETITAQIGSFGICTQLSLALYHFKPNETIALNGCKATARLAYESVSHIDAFLEADMVHTLEQVLAIHSANDQVVVSAAYALSGLAISEVAKAKIAGNVSILDSILEALCRSTLAELSTACCAVIARLAADDIECALYLGEHEVCVYIYNAVATTSSDPTFCREACFALTKLTEHCPPNIARFEVPICRELTAVLARHVFLPVVCERCLSAISCFLSRTDMLLELEEAGLCEALVQVLKTNLRQDAVVERVLSLVCSLGSLNARLGRAGMCNGVISSLVTHNTTPDIARLACCAICSLSDDETNKATLGALHACEAVVALLTKIVDEDAFVRAVVGESPQTASVSVWACRAIHCLATGHQGHQAILGTSGACELVVRSLSLYRGYESAAVACSMACCALGEFNCKHKVALGDAGMCAELMESLRHFVASEQVALWATRAAASLALESESNLLKLVAAGACETVPVTMQAHQRVEEIAYAGCSIIASLASNVPTAGRLGHNGAVEALVVALELHAASAVVVNRASLAIIRLCQSVGNTSWLGPAGACEALLSAIKLHTENESVSFEAWYAVGSMANDLNNCIRLGNAGACKMVVDALTTHPDSELIVDSASRAVGKLSKYPKNAVAIHSAGDCDVIIASLQKHRRSELASAQLCQTLSILALGDAAVRGRLGALGACELVVEALIIHRGSANLVHQGFLAVRSLAFESLENQTALRTCNVFEVLVGLKEEHSGNKAVQIAFCWAVSNLSAGNTLNASSLGSHGVCESVIRILADLADDVFACRYATSALYHLTLNNDESCNKCTFSGAADALVAVCARQHDDIIVAECVLHTMKHLCRSSIGRHKLGTAGGCRAVVMCFQSFDRDRRVMLLLLGLIFALSLENIDNQIRLIESGVLRAIVAWMHVFIDMDEGGEQANCMTKRDADRLKPTKPTKPPSVDFSRASIYTGNLSRAFATVSAITDEACLAIASVAEGQEELNRRRQSDSGSSLFGLSLMKITASLDASDAIIDLAKKHIQVWLSESSTAEADNGNTDGETASADNKDSSIPVLAERDSTAALL